MAQSRLTTIECLPEPFDGERLREVCAIFDANPNLWAKIDTSGGTLAADELVHGELLCRVYADGEPVAIYVLHFYTAQEGREAFITLAYGRAALDLCRVVLPLIELQCAGCRGIGMRTKRPGLKRKLGAAGYVTVSDRDGVAQMRKAL
ncbi:hypothetical protein [Burkholderia vietnamiensis]|uniref:hypothetical protein n=1 Tax=Burkholderia vietnamiensis TaxID=60552 RepID=UPI002013BAAE|nr:hypothetical protein [Burkholderia vietnamiensis]